MKMFFRAFCLILALSACSEKEAAQNQQKSDYSAEVKYSYTAKGLTEECKLDSEVVCAVEAAVKCVLNPNFEICKKHNLPDFIFMEDESLNRPTEESFSVTKLKPLADGVMEVYTKSECNGNMFGLCQGNVIYVLKNKNGQGWRVTDIYAVE